MSALVRTEGLIAGYGRDGRVVHGIDIEVGAGEVVALLGANGAGKTTTLLTLAGELPVLGGACDVLGAAASTPLHRRARRGLGFVTERRAVLMSLTVAENLKVTRCDQDRVLELFPELAEHLGRRVGLLSGGQQQMLALGWTLARPTKLLLADELSLGLAPLVVARLLGVLRAAADDGLGVLLVEQHIHKALEIADRVYVMRRGRIAIAGTAAELRDQIDDVQASYLSTAGRAEQDFRYC